MRNFEHEATCKAMAEKLTPKGARAVLERVDKGVVQFPESVLKVLLERAGADYSESKKEESAHAG